MLKENTARVLTIAATLILTGAARPPCAMALDGVNALELMPRNGWDAFELVSLNDNISAISDSGYGNSATRSAYDGLGAYLYDGGDTLSVFINHENSDAAISRLDLNVTEFRQAINSIIDGGVTPFPSSFVTGMGYAYDTIFDDTYHAVNNPNAVATGTVAVGNYGNANFNRFCSGTSHLANAFGPARGFVDEMYTTGEEEAGGKYFALDRVTQTLWEVDAVGLGAWENSAAVDTGNTTHVALVLMSDTSSDTIQMYVGKKGVDVNSDGEIDFLERNGLRGGTVYHFDPDGAASTTTLPDDGGQVAGRWSTSTSGALFESKLEDIHTNPFDGTQAVFADQTDGVYRMDVDLQFNGDNLDTANSTTTITQIINNSTSINAPDNLTWSEDGKLYVQEDGSGDDIWQTNADGTGHIKIADTAPEPSGIFDVSRLAGYEPGSVLLTSVQRGPAQVAVLISPTAMPIIPEPTTAWLLAMGGLQLLLVRRR
jgi:hypothetical protein